MSDATKHAILHYLDEPVRFLYWTKGELGFYFIIPWMGMLLEQFFPSVLLTLIGGFLHRSFKKRFGNINIAVMYYWYLPPNKRSRTLPLSYIKSYVG
jgi:hypothetical protein